MSQTILAFDVNIAGVGSQLMPVAPPSRVESAVEVCTIVTIFGLHDSGVHFSLEVLPS